MPHVVRIFFSEEENLPMLKKDGIILTQSVVRASLHFGKIIDNLMLVTVNEIGSQHSSPTGKKVNFNILVTRLHVN